MAPKVADKVSIARRDAVRGLTRGEQKPASTAGKAPASKAPAGKAPSAAKKAVKKTPAGDGEKKTKKRKTRKETYSTYIYKVRRIASHRVVSHRARFGGNGRKWGKSVTATRRLLFVSHTG